MYKSILFIYAKYNRNTFPTEQVETEGSKKNFNRKKPQHNIYTSNKWLTLYSQY